MSLPAFSINRPVTILMAAIIVCLVGIISMFFIPVELMPNITYGQITIIIHIRGGIPPSEVEERVTKLVEEAVSTVSNLEEIFSNSKDGESTVTLSFKPGTDMNFAALEVREKFAKVKNKLPPEIEKPVIANYKYSDYPIYMLAFISKRYSPEAIRIYVEKLLEEPIKRIGGVANIDTVGGREKKIIVEIDQTRAKAGNVDSDMILAAISRNNINLLVGDYRKGQSKFLVRALGEFKSVEEIQNIGVSITPSGGIIRLKDIASVKDAYAEAGAFARLNERPVVSVYIQKESTANTINVAKNIKEELDRIKPMFPKEIQMVTTYDQSEFIKKSIDTVNIAVLQGALLAILILLVFLTDLKKKYIIPLLLYMGIVLFAPTKLLFVIMVATIAAMVSFRRFRFVLIIAVSIPISVLVAFGAIYLVNQMGSTDITLNIMTLTGLALGIGMLVDNSIVVLENIFTYWGKPMSPKDIACKASEEMTLVIVSGTLTTLVVFLPVLFVNAKTKLLYGGIALTVTLSLLASLVVALSIVPLISSRMTEVAKAATWVSRLYVIYRKWAIKALRHRRGVIIFAAVSFIISIIIFAKFDKEFIASTAQNDFTIYVRLPAGTRLEMCDLACRKVEGILRKIPEVQSASSQVELWTPKVYVKLVPSIKRRRTVSQVIESIRHETDNIKLYFPQDENIRQPFIYFVQPQEVGSREIILDVYGHDYKILRELASSMASRIDIIKGFTDVKIGTSEGRPELGLKVNRNNAAYYGLSASDIASSVHGQMRGMRVTYYRTEGKKTEVVARLDEKYRKTFEDVRRLILSPKEGDDVFVGQVTDFKYDLGPSEIFRKNKSRIIQVSANIGSLSLGRAVKDIKKSVTDIKFPEDYYYDFGGNYKELVESQKQFLPTLLLMLALVYMVLASLYENYTQPFIIMISIPLMMVGVAFSLWITRSTVSIGVIVGIIMLGGIVVNNAIILIDRVNSLRQKGLSPVKAIVLSGQSRLRPILMTTATTVLGLLPMAIERSENAGLWSPLAITVIGGLTSSTILTLFVIPCIYIAWEDVKARMPQKDLVSYIKVSFKKLFGYANV